MEWYLFVDIASFIDKMHSLMLKQMIDPPLSTHSMRQNLNLQMNVTSHRQVHDDHSVAFI